MTTSQALSLSSTISLKDEAISPFEVGYLKGAARDEAYEAFFKIFDLERAEDSRFTKAFVARRTGKSPEQITRYLGSPGNWTIETFALLCAALGYKATFSAEKISQMRMSNQHNSLLDRPLKEAPSRPSGRTLEYLGVRNELDMFVGIGRNNYDQSTLHTTFINSSASASSQLAGYQELDLDCGTNR